VSTTQAKDFWLAQKTPLKICHWCQQAQKTFLASSEKISFWRLAVVSLEVPDYGSF